MEMHPEYKKDSVVSGRVCYDLLSNIDRIGQGEVGVPELFGESTLKMSDAVFKKYLEIKGIINSFEDDAKNNNDILARCDVCKSHCDLQTSHK